MDPLLGLVLVRVIREEPAPLSGRDVYLRFTLFHDGEMLIDIRGRIGRVVVVEIRISTWRFRK